MDQSKFLILGANGQVGRALQIQFPESKKTSSDELDITNPEQLNSYGWSGVSVILNAAGYTDVDGAETPEGRVLAHKVNAEGVANLAQIAKQHDLTLVHFSTEYVFNGQLQTHTENEPFDPLNIYGQTKAEGDKSVATVPKHYILRTSWVIGDGKNFVQIMLGLAKKDISPSVIADNTGRPTFASELARAVEHLLSTKAAYGTYNISNDGEPANWAVLTRNIFNIAGFTNLTVTDITTTAYYADKPGAAKRPIHSIFDLSKIRATGFKSTDWHDDLRKYIQNELQKEAASS